MLECYMDFLTPTLRNENFVLTRTKTKMGGHSYCDFCFHDKRFEEEIEQPIEEFWENFTMDGKRE